MVLLTVGEIRAAIHVPIFVDASCRRNACSLPTNGGLVRMSVGCEPLDDLKRELAKGLAGV